MPTKRSGTAGFLINNKIYIVGGGYKKPDGNFQFLKTTEIYDIATNSWESGPDMNQPHDYPAATQLGDTIYILGGHHPDACLGGPKTDTGFDFCERWSPGDNTWEEITPMPTPRFAAHALARDGIIYTSGGGAFTPEGFNNSGSAIKKNIPNYNVESGFVYSEDRDIKFGESFTLSQEIASEIMNLFSQKVWISVGKGVFVFIEEDFVLNSRIVLTEKTQSMI